MNTSWYEFYLIMWIRIRGRRNQNRNSMKVHPDEKSRQDAESRAKAYEIVIEDLDEFCREFEQKESPTRNHKS